MLYSKKNTLVIEDLNRILLIPTAGRSLYSEPLTPSSNPGLSPGGSPLREGPLEKPGLPSPAEWSEFLSASNSKVERDLAQLTLSDPEQRELYEAARLVQTAFRKCKVQATGLRYSHQ